jgi:hypothetical protein
MFCNSDWWQDIVQMVMKHYITENMAISWLSKEKILLQ